MNRLVLSLAIPSILASMTVPLVGMVDLAIAGHMGDASMMSGVVIGSVLFDLIYWNVGFLRIGTAGLTAQAFGRKDKEGMMRPFCQGIVTAIAVAVLMLALQWVVVNGALAIMDCTEEVRIMASRYFYVRIWAMPAAMLLFVFRGWFVGMQNTKFQMIVDVSVNVINMLSSYVLAIHTSFGFDGIALGTVIAQWTGLLLSVGLMFGFYRKILSFNLNLITTGFSHFFRLNRDNFLRNIGLQIIYSGFTIFATYFGEVQLALSAVMMKLLLGFSYFVDGFAFAGEALTGRFIGEKNREGVNGTIRTTFGWGLAIGIVFTFVYVFWGKTFISLFTNDVAVIDASEEYLFWLWLMPVVSCLCFVWDGIYIGATASAPMRDSMLWAAVLFVISYYCFRPLLGAQSIYIAYFIHLITRSVYMTMKRNVVYRQC